MDSCCFELVSSHQQGIRVKYLHEQDTTGTELPRYYDLLGKYRDSFLSVSPPVAKARRTVGRLSFTDGMYSWQCNTVSTPTTPLHRHAEALLMDIWIQVSHQCLSVYVCVFII